jgi:hypothetical protein
MSGSSPLLAFTPGSRWIYRPAIHLIVGCGAWSAPLLLLANRSAGATRSLAVVFYLLARVLNFPHDMSTVYRAHAATLPAAHDNAQIKTVRALLAGYPRARTR